MTTKAQLKKALKNPTAHVTEVGFPEVGFFTEKTDLQKFYKKLDTEVIAEWVELEGLEFKPCPESPSIHRMRLAQAVLYKHFPKAPSKPKQKSKYADYTTEQLVEMAVANEVPVEATDDLRILRMRTIMALRAHKLVD